jgi:5-methylcytosine-specific restriction endonuclease McrA
MSRHSARGTRWEKLRQIVYANHGRVCACGAEADTIDHVIPTAKGGTTTLDNLIPMCRTCNSIKKDNVKKRVNYANKKYGIVIN